MSPRAVVAAKIGGQEAPVAPDQGARGSANSRHQMMS